MGQIKKRGAFHVLVRMKKYFIRINPQTYPSLFTLPLVPRISCLPCGASLKHVNSYTSLIVWSLVAIPLVWALICANWSFWCSVIVLTSSSLSRSSLLSRHKTMIPIIRITCRGNALRTVINSGDMIFSLWWCAIVFSKRVYACAPKGHMMNSGVR